VDTQRRTTYGQS